MVSDEESKYIWEHFDPERFRGVELILSCGDLSADYLGFLVSMIPAPLFYVPGNHDKSFVDNPPAGCDSLDGKILVFKGKRFFGLGGCKSSKNEPFEYTEADMARIVSKKKLLFLRHGGFDVFVTHAPAQGVGDGTDSFHQGFETFLKLNEQYKPEYHFFGHQHTSYGRVQKKIVRGPTTYMNACGYHILDI